MGKPSFVLLNDVAMWFWHQADRSPWYPTLNLVRQQEPANWRDVVDRIIAALGRAEKLAAWELDDDRQPRCQLCGYARRPDADRGGDGEGCVVSKRSAKKQKIDHDEGRDYTYEADGQHVPNIMSGHASARFGRGLGNSFATSFGHPRVGSTKRERHPETGRC
jgi:hypothetical protein